VLRNKLHRHGLKSKNQVIYHRGERRVRRDLISNTFTVSFPYRKFGGILYNIPSVARNLGGVPKARSPIRSVRRWNRFTLLLKMALHISDTYLNLPNQKRICN